MPLVSVVIPNHDGMDHLPLCLESLYRQTFGDFEVIVVDNGSVDRSTEYVEEHYPSAVVIKFPRNEGFAKAVNEGIRRSKRQYIALLNNDIELSPTWLETLLTALQGQNDVGSVACKMMNFYDRTVIDSAGDILIISGGAGARGHGQKDTGQFEQSEFVFGACAGAALYKREVFTHVGLFDEDFFAWFEDVDHDLRSQLLGYKCLYVPHAVCYHKRGATRKNITALAVQLHVRNQIAYLVKGLPFRLLISYFPNIVKSRIDEWYAYSRDGYFVDVTRGILGALITLPANIRKRKSIQSKRKVSVEYVSSLLLSQP